MLLNPISALSVQDAVPLGGHTKPGINCFPDGRLRDIRRTQVPMSLHGVPSTETANSRLQKACACSRRRKCTELKLKKRKHPDFCYAL